MSDDMRKMEIFLFNNRTRKIDFLFECEKIKNCENC